MTEVLGFKRYVAQGGDYGGIITSWLAFDHPEPLAAIHLNMLGFRPPVSGSGQPPNTEELAWLAASEKRRDGEAAYQQIQGTKPQSLAYGLTDSPAGLAAWVVEKFKTWSDCGDDIESSYSKDQLLENIMLYWVTGTINSAMRFYYECIGPNAAPQDDWAFVTVPTAHARFPAEIRPTPRAWAEQMYNIVRWTKLPKGGHFAAFEQPDLFVEDLREFCRDYR